MVSYPIKQKTLAVDSETLAVASETLAVASSLHEEEAHYFTTSKNQILATLAAHILQMLRYFHFIFLLLTAT